MSINVFFSRKFINDGLSRCWARKFMTKICCSIFLLHFLFIVQPHTHKKYKKNKKCYNHDCLASPPLLHLPTFSEVWHDNENSGNSGCALWFRRKRRRRKFEKAHKSFYEIMIRKFFPLSHTIKGKKSPKCLLTSSSSSFIQMSIVKRTTDLRGGRTRRRRAVKTFYHLSDCNRTKKGEVKQLAVQH